MKVPVSIVARTLIGVAAFAAVTVPLGGSAVAATVPGSQVSASVTGTSDEGGDGFGWGVVGK
ncbi:MULTISPECIES: hypothetical protein [Streptomyces]|uniref:hypothetical protein n=1 Tax=Streptomyces TaxID=1883 RepID=UPI0006AD27FE|nr:hypothetical protein [Streptomyces sp. CFMR 7]ALC29377.1 hypothetical protein ABE83_21615 [Streptomyces sp. CFMR 7]